MISREKPQLSASRVSRSRFSGACCCSGSSRGSPACRPRGLEDPEASLGCRVFDHLHEAASEECYFEWSLGPAHLDLEDGLWTRAWDAFFDVLSQAERDC